MRAAKALAPPRPTQSGTIAGTGAKQTVPNMASKHEPRNAGTFQEMRRPSASSRRTLLEEP